jgi:hypothetical protein
MYSLDKIFRFKKKRISSFLCDRLCRLKVTASVSVESGTRRPFSNLLLFNENFSMARLSAMLYTWLIIHVRDRFVSVSSFLLIYACVSVCRCVCLWLYCICFVCNAQPTSQTLIWIDETCTKPLPLLFVWLDLTQPLDYSLTWKLNYTAQDMNRNTRDK